MTSQFAKKLLPSQKEAINVRNRTFTGMTWKALVSVCLVVGHLQGSDESLKLGKLKAQCEEIKKTGLTKIVVQCNYTSTRWDPKVDALSLQTGETRTYKTYTKSTPFESFPLEIFLSSDSKVACWKHTNNDVTYTKDKYTFEIEANDCSLLNPDKFVKQCQEGVKNNPNDQIEVKASSVEEVDTCVDLRLYGKEHPTVTSSSVVVAKTESAASSNPISSDDLPKGTERLTFDKILGICKEAEGYSQMSPFQSVVRCAGTRNVYITKVEMEEVENTHEFKFRVAFNDSKAFQREPIYKNDQNKVYLAHPVIQQVKISGVHTKKFDKCGDLIKTILANQDDTTVKTEEGYCNLETAKTLDECQAALDKINNQSEVINFEKMVGPVLLPQNTACTFESVGEEIRSPRAIEIKKENAKRRTEELAKLATTPQPPVIISPGKTEPEKNSIPQKKQVATNPYQKLSKPIPAMTSSPELSPENAASSKQFLLDGIRQEFTKQVPNVQYPIVPYTGGMGGALTFEKAACADLKTCKPKVIVSELYGEGSLFEALKLRPGTTIRQINNREVLDVESAIAIFADEIFNILYKVQQQKPQSLALNIDDPAQFHPGVISVQPSQVINIFNNMRL